jgi:hypothetical protein
MGVVDCYRGAMRSAYCTLPLSRKEGGVVAMVQCAALIAPYPLAAGAGVRLDAVKVATAPGCRCHIAPLTIDHEKGANRRRWISYGFIERLTMAAITQLSETRSFFALTQALVNYLVIHCGANLERLAVPGNSSLSP